MQNFLLPLAGLPIMAGTMSILLESTVRGSALLLTAGIAALALWRAPAAMRHLVWNMGLAGILVMPAVSLVAPSWRVLPPWMALEIAWQSDMGAAKSRDVRSNDGLPGAGKAMTSVAGAAGALREHVEHTASDGQATLPASGDADSSAAEPVTFSGRSGRNIMEWLPWATFVWSIVGSLLMARVLASWLVLESVLRTARKVEEGPLCDVVDGARGELGVRKQVDVYTSDRRELPMTWGIMRPCVLLPAQSADWLPDRLRAVVLHELAHIRRFDPLTHLAGQVACAVYWFNPLVWLAGWRMHVERERACDDLVVSHGVKASDYAEHLLRIVSGCRPSRVVRSAAVAMARPSRLEARLRGILSDRQRRKSLSRTVGIAVMALSVFTTTVAATLQSAAPDGRKEDSVVKSASAEREPRRLAGEESKKNEEGNEGDSQVRRVPITVKGRAMDLDGDPVAGARIFICSLRHDPKRIAETVTDAEGRYAFRDILLPVPVVEPSSDQSHTSGRFEVFGMATGFGFAWRPPKDYYPDPSASPSDFPGVPPPGTDLPKRYFAGDSIELDLHFRPAATLRGRIVDNEGKPIAGTRIGLWFAAPVPDSGVDTKKKFLSGSPREFYSLYLRDVIPTEMRNRTSNADGWFEYTTVPTNTRFTINIRPPGFARRMIWATTAKLQKYRLDDLEIHRDGMQLIFTHPRKVPVSVRFEDTGKPAPNVFVGAYRRDAGDWSVTDEAGVCYLNLPPGQYQGEVRSEYRTPYISSRDVRISVAPMNEELVPIALNLKRAAEVDVHIIDAETGRGLAGVDIWIRTNGSRSEYVWQCWQPPRTAMRQRPVTDADGRMTVFFEPGEYFVGAGYVHVPSGYGIGKADAKGKRIECRAGVRQQVTIEMRRTAGP